MKCMPNLFIPGAAKSGTSSLHDYLNQHPDINMSLVKEPHFFCDNRSKDEWEKYLGMFDSSFKYNGESSTGYMVFDEVIDRMEYNLASVKFIFILRNPIDRVISHYNWLSGIGCEGKNILEAFEFDFSLEPEYKVKPKGAGYKNYYQWGLYYKYLKRFYKNVPSENIIVITTESLQQKPQDTLNKCTDFLGLKRYMFESSKRTNKSILVKHKKLYFFLNFFSFNDTLFGKVYQLLPLRVKNIARATKRSIVQNLQKNATVIHTANHDEEIRKKIKMHYLEDVRKLKDLIKSDLSEWSDFSRSLK